MLNKVIQSTSFMGNVTKVSLGSLFAQTVALLAAPAITRIYAPEDLGTTSLFVSFVLLGLTLVHLNYPQAVVLPKSNEAALSLVFITSLIVLGLIVCLSSIGALLGPFWITYFPGHTVGQWLFFAALFMLFSGLYEVLRYWLTRQKQFHLLAGSRVSISVCRAAVQILLPIWIGATALGLILGHLLAQALGCLLLLRAFRTEAHALVRAVKKEPPLAWLKRYRQFPLYAMPSSLMNTLGHRLPILMLAAFFSKDVVGYYALSLAVISQPLTLLGNAVSSVAYQKTADMLARKEPLSLFVERLTAALFLISLFPAALLLVAAPQLFGFVFGSDWSTAGQYTQWLVVPFMLRFVSAPVTLFAQLNKQRLLLVWHLVWVFAQLLVFLYSSINPSALLILSVFAIVSSFCYVWLWFLNFRLAGATFRGWLRAFGYILLHLGRLPALLRPR